ncbi:RnfH family protein [Plasticicumulans acidivorans]|uniref:RnfH family protein n=1 Tax=Plasticicumulans acidivorans TaxID=886464 RepID=UPI000D711868|nr:RnfH family protein [Plasticicumulans acidivorans]
MAEIELIKVEVAYACPERQVVLPVELASGSTVRDALLVSRISDRFPEINPEQVDTGIFGKAAKLDTVLRSGDRVEIYRALVADPKAVRKQRAAEGKRMKKGGGDLPDGA